MNSSVKIAIIVAATCLIGLFLWLYFSPFNSCVRSLEGEGILPERVAQLCAGAR
jgi:hypothetical protein